MLIYSFAFFFCYFLPCCFSQKFNILTKETNATNATNATKRQRLERLTNDNFEWETICFPKNKNKYCITAGETRFSSCLGLLHGRCIRPSVFMWRCSRIFICSHSKRLQRVVHTMPTTRANICVLSKLMWRLCKQCINILAANIYI